MATFEEIKKIIAPAGIEAHPSHLKIGSKFAKTLFFFTYPRFLSTGWFEQIINMPELLDISIFVNPFDTGLALKNLRKKSAQVESQLASQAEKGLVRDPLLETALSDVEDLRDTLQQSQERLFTTGVYITAYADTLEALAKIENKIVSLMEAKLIYIKPALFQQLQGYMTNLPLAQDKLNVTTPMNSGPLSSFFPFTSEDLVSEEGVMYGINRHNNSLVIFDRFSMQNANQVVLAQPGSGKSYATKLEIIRSLMMGTEVIVIDPENEYQRLAEAFGGTVVNISLSSDQHINPLDIPVIPDNELPADVLRNHFDDVTGLVKLMLGELTAEESALLDRAISETYASREITPDSDFTNVEPPLLGDLETVLRGIDGGRSMAERLYKYTQGSYAGFLNQKTNVDLSNRLIVFSIRDLEEGLRPLAMYVTLNFIWSLIRSKLKRRIMIIDEAWLMMRYEESAKFLYGLVKRARKYYLGVTTITQDVEDFLRSPYGRPVVTNSSVQLLLRQSSATIDIIQKAFSLTEAEKSILLSAEVGTGLFIAGQRHIAIQIVPSFFEDKLITTNPQQLLAEQAGNA